MGGGERGGYQDTVKGATTLSPTWTEVTSLPAWTTVPTNSWPIMKPVGEGWWPR